MRRNNLLSSFRRAFSLTELIIVLVILGLLAAISIVGYAAVVDRSEDVAAEATAASVEREMRALMAFDAGSDLNGTEESLNNAFQAVKADLPADVQLSTIGGTLQNDLACGEQVVVIRDSQNSGVFTPLCDTGVVDYTQSWLTVGDGSNSGGKITVGDESLVVTSTSPQALNVVASGYQQFNMTFDEPLDDGGSAVTGYEYRYAFDGVEPTGSWTAVTSSPVNFTAPGGSTSIEVHVRAVNAAGTSDAAEYTASIPQFFPNPVSNLVVTPVGPGLFNYSFDPAIVPNSGPAVTEYSYRYSIDGGAETGWLSFSTATSGSFATANALTDIVLSVKALNSAGESTVVSATESIPPFTPAAPAALAVEAVGLGVLVDYTITEGVDVGSPTTDWEWRYAVNGATWSAWDSTGSADLTGQVTIPGMVYTDVFEVEMRGVNTHGSGLATLAANTVPDFTPDTVEFIVVAGGGGSGIDPTSHVVCRMKNYSGSGDQYEWCQWGWTGTGEGGGGGAGGYISSVQGENSGRNTAPVPAIEPKNNPGVTYTVSVGQRGMGKNWVGDSGNPSTLSASDGSMNHVARGGGGGGAGDCVASQAGRSGGSGGGGGQGQGGSYHYCDPGSVGNRAGDGSGTAGQGYNGGRGGGGAAGGGNSSTGCGGAAMYSSITGTSRPYAAGGSARWCENPASDYGRGGRNGSSGQDGVVILRFADTKGVPTISGDLTYTVTQAAGYTVVKFTSGTGSFSW